MVDLIDGLGLGPREPDNVAEAGNRGGGMSSCLGGWGGGSSRAVLALAIFEELRFQLRLSFRRREDPDDGVSGSVGLDGFVRVSSLEVRVAV